MGSICMMDVAEAFAGISVERRSQRTDLVTMLVCREMRGRREPSMPTV